MRHLDMCILAFLFDTLGYGLEGVVKNVRTYNLLSQTGCVSSHLQFPRQPVLHNSQRETGYSHFHSPLPTGITATSRSSMFDVLCPVRLPAARPLGALWWQHGTIRVVVI